MPTLPTQEEQTSLLQLQQDRLVGLDFLDVQVSEFINQLDANAHKQMKKDAVKKWIDGVVQAITAKNAASVTTTTITEEWMSEHEVPNTIVLSTIVNASDAPQRKDAFASEEQAGKRKNDETQSKAATSKRQRSNDSSAIDSSAKSALSSVYIDVTLPLAASAVHFLGSHPVRTTTNSDFNIDIGIQMPNDLFDPRDIVNHGYFDKRKLFVAAVYAHLRKQKGFYVPPSASASMSDDRLQEAKHRSNIKGSNMNMKNSEKKEKNAILSESDDTRYFIEIGSLKGDDLKPILVIRPSATLLLNLGGAKTKATSKGSKGTKPFPQLEIRLIPMISVDCFKISQLRAEKNNVRPLAWRKKVQDNLLRGAANEGLDPSTLLPTPAYNAAIMEDMSMLVHQRIIERIIKPHANLRLALVLFKFWLQQRDFQFSVDGFDAHHAALLIAYLVQSRRIQITATDVTHSDGSPVMSAPAPLHVLKTVLAFLSSAGAGGGVAVGASSTLFHHISTASASASSSVELPCELLQVVMDFEDAALKRKQQSFSPPNSSTSSTVAQANTGSSISESSWPLVLLHPLSGAAGGGNGPKIRYNAFWRVGESTVSDLAAEAQASIFLLQRHNLLQQQHRLRESTGCAGDVLELYTSKCFDELFVSSQRGFFERFDFFVHLEFPAHVALREDSESVHSFASEAVTDTEDETTTTTTSAALTGTAATAMYEAVSPAMVVSALAASAAAILQRGLGNRARAVRSHIRFQPSAAGMSVCGSNAGVGYTSAGSVGDLSSEWAEELHIQPAQQRCNFPCSSGISSGHALTATAFRGRWGTGNSIGGLAGERGGSQLGSWVVSLGILSSAENALRRVDRSTDPNPFSSTPSIQQQQQQQRISPAQFSNARLHAPLILPLHTSFGDFWGEKCQLRRFRDGAIVEAVVWEMDITKRGSDSSKSSGSNSGAMAKSGMGFSTADGLAVCVAKYVLSKHISRMIVAPAAAAEEHEESLTIPMRLSSSSSLASAELFLSSSMIQHIVPRLLLLAPSAVDAAAAASAAVESRTQARKRRGDDDDDDDDNNDIASKRNKDSSGGEREVDIIFPASATASASDGGGGGKGRNLFLSVDSSSKKTGRKNQINGSVCTVTAKMLQSLTYSLHGSKLLAHGGSGGVNAGVGVGIVGSVPFTETNDNGFASAASEELRSMFSATAASSSTNASRGAVELLDRLRRVLTRDIHDLPLAFDSITPCGFASQELRYTNLVPISRPHPFVQLANLDNNNNNNNNNNNSSSSSNSSNGGGERADDDGPVFDAIAERRAILRPVSGRNVSLLVKPIVVFAKFESSGKWPLKDPEAVLALKAALLLRAKMELWKQFKIESVMQTDCLDVCFDGHLFRLLPVAHNMDIELLAKFRYPSLSFSSASNASIEGKGSNSDSDDDSGGGERAGATSALRVNKNGGLLRKPAAISSVAGVGLTPEQQLRQQTRVHAVRLAEVHDLVREQVIAPLRHTAVKNLHSKFPSYSACVKLLSLWVAHHSFSGHVCHEALELVAASVYLEDRARAPASALHGFYRSLHRLASHNWLSEPLIVDLDHINDIDTAGQPAISRLQEEQQEQQLQGLVQGVGVSSGYSGPMHTNMHILAEIHRRFLAVRGDLGQISEYSTSHNDHTNSSNERKTVVPLSAMSSLDKFRSVPHLLHRLNSLTAMYIVTSLDKHVDYFPGLLPPVAAPFPLGTSIGAGDGLSGAGALTVAETATCVLPESVVLRSMARAAALSARKLLWYMGGSAHALPAQLLLSYEQQIRQKQREEEEEERSGSMLANKREQQGNKENNERSHALLMAKSCISDTDSQNMFFLDAFSLPFCTTALLVSTATHDSSSCSSNSSNSSNRSSSRAGQIAQPMGKIPAGQVGACIKVESDKVLIHRDSQAVARIRYNAVLKFHKSLVNTLSRSLTSLSSSSSSSSSSSTIAAVTTAAAAGSGGSLSSRDIFEGPAIAKCKIFANLSEEDTALHRLVVRPSAGHGVHPIQEAIFQRLRERFSEYAIFFWNELEGDQIGLVWRPSAFVPKPFSVLRCSNSTPIVEAPASSSNPCAQSRPQSNKAASSISSSGGSSGGSGSGGGSMGLMAPNVGEIVSKMVEICDGAIAEVVFC